MTFRGEGEPRGVMKMAEGMLRKRMNKQFEGNAKRLKALLEE
jgi:hypothetical protein